MKLGKLAHYCLGDEAHDVLPRVQLWMTGRNTLVLEKFDQYFNVRKNVIFPL